LLILSVELALCHASGTYTFEAIPRFFKNLWAPANKEFLLKS